MSKLSKNHEIQNIIINKIPFSPSSLTNVKDNIEGCQEHEEEGTFYTIGGSKIKYSIFVGKFESTYRILIQ